jgi:magnesium transporter
MSKTDLERPVLDAQTLGSMHAADIAELFDQTSAQEHAQILKVLDVEARAGLLIYLDAKERQDLLVGRSADEIAELIRDMDSDDATDLLGGLEEKTQISVLASVRRDDPAEAADLSALLKYPVDSAGGLMQAEIASIVYGATAGEALDVLRASRDDADSMHHIFVTDSHHRFIGVVRMARLALAQPGSPIAEIFEPKFIDVQPDVDQQEVAHIFAKYDIITLAVVDAEERLLGRIMADDVMEVLAQEADEDAFLMVGSDADELLHQRSPMRVAFIRLPWLLINLIGSVVTGWMLFHFQGTLIDNMALISFVPVITAMAGNVGAQSAMILIRSHAAGRNVDRQAWLHFGRESMTGLFIGVPCGLLLGLGATFWHGNPKIGIIVALSLFVVMTISAAIGGIAPSLFRRLGIDPAIAAGPFVTTANDLIGIAIYMAVAAAVLA